MEDRDRTRAALHNTDARYRALFNATLDAIIIVDDHYTIVETNPAACELLHATAGQLTGRPMSDFMPPAASASAREEFRKFSTENKIWEGSWPVKSLDGTIHDLHWRAVSNFLPGLHLSVGRRITHP